MLKDFELSIVVEITDLVRAKRYAVMPRRLLR